MANGTPTNKVDTPPAKGMTPEEKMREIYTTVVTDDGKLDWDKVPSDTQVSDEMKLAVQAEKRRVDTQRGFTKKAQQLAELEAQNKVLAEKATQNIDVTISEELEELKWKDPDAYIEKVTALKEAEKAKNVENLQKELEKAKSEAKTKAQLEGRKTFLDEFNALNPDKPLTPELLDSQIPLALAKQLEDGSIDFEEAIYKAHDFIYGENQIAQPKTPTTTSLGDVGSGNVGSGTPTIGSDELTW